MAITETNQYTVEQLLRELVAKTDGGGQLAVVATIGDVTADGESLSTTRIFNPGAFAGQIVQDTGSSIVLPDISSYGPPYKTITLTKTGGVAVADIVLAYREGFVLLTGSMDATTDSIAISALSVNDDTIDAIPYFDLADSTIKETAISGAATFSILLVW